MFARDGYHSAQMDEIARLAGVSKPMLYTYFGSKEGLYLAYIERSGQELLERLQGSFTARDPGSVRLPDRVMGFLEFVEERRDGWKVLFREASASRPVAEEVAVLRGRLAEAVCRLIRGGPAIDSTAAEAAAHAIVGAGESLANWWLEHPEVPRAQVAEWYVTVIRGAVAALSTGAPS